MMEPVGFSKFSDPLDMDKCFEVAIDVMTKCKVLLQTEGKIRHGVEMKSHPRDIRTEADVMAEKFIIAGISKHFPDHKFIGEESQYDSQEVVDLSNDPTWIIDPIDGTLNFVHNFPFYCSSLAFFVWGKPQIGIVCNIALDQCYSARLGKGSFLNGEPIHCSQQTKLSDALVMHEFGSGIDYERLKTIVHNSLQLTRRTHGLRSVGSAAITCCLIASGAIDAFYHFGLHLWDYAAGILIVTEAGGVALDPSGGEMDFMARRLLAAATPELAAELAKNLKQCYPRPRDDEPQPEPDENAPRKTQSELELEDCICKRCHRVKTD